MFDVVVVVVVTMMSVITSYTTIYIKSL